MRIQTQNIFARRLKVEVHKVAQSSHGRLFQMRGANTVNALSANPILLKRTTQLPEDEVCCLGNEGLEHKGSMIEIDIMCTRERSLYSVVLTCCTVA